MLKPNTYNPAQSYFRMQQRDREEQHRDELIVFHLRELFLKKMRASVYSRDVD